MKKLLPLFLAALNASAVIATSAGILNDSIVYTGTVSNGGAEGAISPTGLKAVDIGSGKVVFTSATGVSTMLTLDASASILGIEFVGSELWASLSKTVQVSPGVFAIGLFLNRYTLNATPPTALTLVETKTLSMTSSDRFFQIRHTSTGGTFVLLYSFNMVETPPGSGHYPKVFTAFYQNPVGVWSTNSPAFSVDSTTMIQSVIGSQQLVQHPSDGALWGFFNRDSSHCIDAFRIVESGGSYSVTTYPQLVGGGTFPATPIDGEIFSLVSQPVNSTILLSYVQSPIFYPALYWAGGPTVFTAVDASGGVTAFAGPTGVNVFTPTGDSGTFFYSAGTIHAIFRPITTITNVFQPPQLYDYASATWTQTGSVAGCFPNLGFIKQLPQNAGYYYYNCSDQSLHLVTPASTSVWYASPNGLASNSGSIANPLSLSKALGDGVASPVKSGDTLYLRGGTYLTSAGASGTEYQSTLVGATVRPYADEKPIIQGTLTNSRPLYVYGSNTIYYGIECWNAALPRGERSPGVYVRAPNTRLRNLVVHDVGVGIYVGEESVDSEVYGCLIYNYGDGVGDQKHGIYAHSTHTLTLRDNVILNGYHFGIHCYSAVAGQLEGISIIGNTVVEAGNLNGGTTRYPLILLGGDTPANNGLVRQNMGYYSTGSSDALELGVTYQPIANGTVTAQQNYFSGGTSSIEQWSSLTMSSNSFYRLSTSFHYDPVGTPSVSWDYSAYSSPFGTPFNAGGTNLNWAGWQALGFDANGSFSASSPVLTKTFVRPDIYTAGRGVVTVFNWATNDNVTVDLSSVLAANQTYVVKNAANYHGTAIKAGTYTVPISLPLTNLTVAVPVGVAAPASTSPNFATFIVEPTANRTVLQSGTVRAGKVKGHK